MHKNRYIVNHTSIATSWISSIKQSVSFTLIFAFFTHWIIGIVDAYKALPTEYWLVDY